MSKRRKAAMRLGATPLPRRLSPEERILLTIAQNFRHDPFMMTIFVTEPSRSSAYRLYGPDSRTGRPRRRKLRAVIRARNHLVQLGLLCAHPKGGPLHTTVRRPVLGDPEVVIRWVQNRMPF